MPYSTIVHHFDSPTPHTFAYETGSPYADNAIIFIGGLGDGPHTIPYVQAVARHFEGDRVARFSVFEIRMASSFDGFGFSSLDRDIADIEGLVTYLRKLGRRKIVLFGHSTGCQDCVHYAAKAYTRTPVDGFILQGPVSDREAMATVMSREEIDEAVALANRMIEMGKKDDAMPRQAVQKAFNSPITAYRFHSLAALGGDDDYFSSDLPPGRVAAIWGAFESPVLILHSAKDQHVPPSVDVVACTKKWAANCRAGIASPLSGSIPGANHRVEQKESQKWMINVVARFLDSI